MVEKLRKTETLLRKWRWIVVLVAGSLEIALFLLLLKIANFPDEPLEGKALVVSIYLAPILLMMAFNAVWLGYLIANGNGNAKTVLLLKLIDEHRG